MKDPYQTKDGSLNTKQERFLSATNGGLNTQQRQSYASDERKSTLSKKQAKAGHLPANGQTFEGFMKS